MKIPLAFAGLCLVTSNMACSGGGGGGSDAAKGLTAVSHNADQCPEFNGTYVHLSDEAYKTLKSVKTSSGMNLEDTGIVWIVDGASHKVEDADGASYIAACDSAKLLIDLKNDSTSVGRMTYELNKKGQLIIQSTSIDANSSQETEIWEPKK